MERFLHSLRLPLTIYKSPAVEGTASIGPEGNAVSDQTDLIQGTLDHLVLART
jgi:hypothetical protein